MGRKLAVKRSASLAFAFALVFVGGNARYASAEFNWQAAVEPSVELTVRDQGARFSADFALTSPKGVTRHARVSSAADGSAHVDFGGSASMQWGLPDESFAPSVTGHWTWSCMVRGRTVAHGSFVIARSSGGSSSIAVLRPEF